MKIRTTLTLKNSIVTAAVFILCLFLVYMLSEHNRSRTFFHSLRSEAVTKAHLFLSGQVDADVMQSIYINNRKFINEVEVAIYDTSFQMLYHDAVQSDIVKEDSIMINDIMDRRDIEFYVGKYQAIGMLYSYGGHDYVVTAAAYDGDGYYNLHLLRSTIILLLSVGLTLLFLVCYFLAMSALKPIRELVTLAETITAGNMDCRLPVGNEKDELGELSLAFNELLSRLEKSFSAQKMFVSNVSHEMRTPLAALIAELDIALQKERSAEQYRIAIGNAVQDARRMNRLVEGLLNLARVDYGKHRIGMQDVRLDELLMDVRQCIIKGHPEYKVEVVFADDDMDDERFITVFGNIYLLGIAFSNLIENNCKYSPDKTSLVQISFCEKWTLLRFSDNGIGLSDDEKSNIFKLFYRGDKENSTGGYGIGMTLVLKIVELHQGRIEVYSSKGTGTTFVIELPHI